MSTETQPLKLMPYTRRVGSSGRLVIEPGAQDSFELPTEYRVFFEILERGSSLSGLVDQSTPVTSGARFKQIRKFLIFLYEHDMLADRDYIRLAESLVTEYSWPTSVLTSDLNEMSLCRASRHPRSKIWLSLALLFTIVLGLLSLVMSFVLLNAFRFEPLPLLLDGELPSLVRGLMLFLLTFSLTRSAVALWMWLVGVAAGQCPQLDLVLEPLSLRLRQEHRDKSVRLPVSFSNILSWLFYFGIAGALGFLSRTPYELDLILLGASFAFFVETSPYSRSTMTDFLRSLFASFDERRADSGRREQAIRRLHISACVTWILFLGLFWRLM